MPAPSIYLTLYVGVILLAGNGLFAKGINLDATSITQIRSVIAAITIALFLCFVKRSHFVKNTKKLIGIYGIGIFMGLHWVTFFHSMQISTIAIGMLSIFTYPVMTVFMEAAIHKSRPHWQDILSTILVLAGILLMTGNELAQPGSATLQGIFWGTLSAFFFASRNVVQKYYFADITSDVLMLHQMIAISLMLFAFIDFSTISTISNIDWIKLLALGTISTAGAHTLLVMSYKNLPAKTVAMISCLQPVIAGLLGWVFIKEQPTFYIVVGGSIILAVAVYESISSRV